MTNLPSYARKYIGLVDRANPYGVSPEVGSLIIFFPALGGLIGPCAYAKDLEDAHARARDVLITYAESLDDPEAWAADIKLLNLHTHKELTV